MFKNIAIATTLAIGLVFAGSASAAEQKIGFVNVRVLMAESPLAAEIQKRLESEFTPQQRELQQQQNDLKALNEKLQRDGETMSQSELQNMQRRIRDMERDLQRSGQQLTEDFRIRRQEELQGLQQALMQQVQRFGERNGYDLILAEGVAYASDAVDVTGQVLAQMKGE
ncbi:MAG: OmpH family outer membrane protein [Gammaproteobacteria bacterium]|nr:OmpH family outer membrane protein [Gammaproteobacteria bacterium]